MWFVRFPASLVLLLVATAAKSPGWRIACVVVMGGAALVALALWAAALAVGVAGGVRGLCFAWRRGEVGASGKRVPVKAVQNKHGGAK